MGVQSVLAGTYLNSEELTLRRRVSFFVTVSRDHEVSCSEVTATRSVHCVQVSSTNIDPLVPKPQYFLMLPFLIRI